MQDTYYKLNDDFEVKIVLTLIQLIKQAKGKKLTIKPSSLLKSAKLDKKQSNILKVSRLLNRLVLHKIIDVEVRNKEKTKVFRYVVDESKEIWKLSKENPEKALAIILNVLRGVKI